MTTTVNRNHQRLQLPVAITRIRGLQNLVELLPHLSPRGIPIDLHPIHKPTLLLAAPAPDTQRQPVVLHVTPDRQQQRIARHIALLILLDRRTLAQRIGADLRRIFVLPRLAQHRVHERLQLLCVVLCVQKFLDQVLPRRIRAVAVRRPDMERHMLPVPRRRGAPLAALNHPPLLRCRDPHPAPLARIARRIGIIITPLDVPPLQVLHVPTIRARHEISALITLQEHALHPAEILHRGCGARNDLPVPVILSPPDAQLDLITLGAGRRRVTVDLIKQDHPATDPPEPSRRVRADQAQAPPRKLLLQNRVGAIFRLRLAHHTLQARRVTQHRGNLLLRVTLSVLNRRLHDHDRARILVNMERSNVIQDLRVPNTGTLHNSDLFYLRICDGIHDSFLIRQCMPSAALCTRLCA